MPVNRHQMMNELELKLANDAEVADDFADVGRQVEYHWKSIVTQPGEHYDQSLRRTGGAKLGGGYATGGYQESIHRESVRGRRAKGSVNAAGKKVGGQIYWHTRVVTYSLIAHFLEYGTLSDEKPGGHWVDLDGKPHRSPNTPTPAFAWAAQVEADFA